jgi:hypothetical protein
MADAFSASPVANRVGSAAAGSALAYGALWFFTLRGRYPDGRAAIQESWRDGWLVGGVSFALGFIGPLLIWPGASLGPLLGILLTGRASA